MKGFIAVVFLMGFSVAVCHAVPYDPGYSDHKTELTKKAFELQACELPTELELPAAPAVIMDLVVSAVDQSVKVVTPQANSPPLTM